MQSYQARGDEPKNQSRFLAKKKKPLDGNNEVGRDGDDRRSERMVVGGGVGNLIEKVRTGEEGES